MTESPRGLEVVQNWMQSVITHPHGIAAGIDSDPAREQIPLSVDDIERVILPSQNLTSIERLEIYGNAYFARLLECLREEFPALRYAADDDTFDAFAFGYLQYYPSRSYTLAELGAKFPQFLEESRPELDPGEEVSWPDFLIDLARLERTYSEVFDGPGIEHERLLQPADLQAVPLDRWPNARLKPVPCLRLMEFRYPVQEFATAVRHRGDDNAEIAFPDPAPTWLAITRREFVVRRHSLTWPQYVLLEALVNGETIESAILQGMEASGESVEVLAGALSEWFQEWTAAPFFLAVELD